MNKKDLEAFAREAAKGIKTEKDLTDMRAMLTKFLVHLLHALLWIMISTPTCFGAGSLSQNKQINSYRQLLYRLICQRQLLQQ